MKRTLFLILFAITLGGAWAQDHYVASFAALPDSWLKSDLSKVFVPAEASTQYVTLNTNVNVNVSSRPTWVTSVSQVSKGVLKLVIRKNSSAASRTGKLNITAKDGLNISLDICQYGSAESVNLDKTEVEFFPDKHIDSLKVTSNVPCTVECPDWIKMQNVGDSLYYFTTDEILYDAECKTDTIKVKSQSGQVVVTALASLKYYKSYWYQKPVFASISDIHIGDENAGYWYNRAPRWLKTLDSYRPTLQYVFIVGDVSDHGYEDHYKNVVSYFKTYLNPNIQRVFVRGNHDWMNGTTGVGYWDNYISKIDNYYINIKGYPFIALGLDANLYTGETLAPETQKFLKESLADAAKRYPDKPIFVFTHTLPKYTIVGSYDSPDYGAYDDNLDEICKPYPQVVSVSGHTHMGLMDPRNIYQKYYTAVNDGSNKSDSHPTKFPGKYHLNAESEPDYYLNEGLFIHFNENDEAIIERWNTSRGTKYEEDWVLTPPFNDVNNFVYTPDRSGGTAPSWPAGASISVTNKTSNSCHITFPQAIDDKEGVNRYIISVVNSSGTSVISNINQSSLQYKGSEQPSTITIPLSGLPKGVTLTVKIQARDYYELSSDNLQTTFTL